MKNPQDLKNFWNQRYKEQRTAWDIGSPSPPLKAYFDQLTDKDLRILIPGAGNAHEAEYLHQQGFRQVFVLDISPYPLQALAQRSSDFPPDHLIEADFFTHAGQYDLIIEQTFFCSFYPRPENRQLYADQVASLLKAEGKLVGLWFDFPLSPDMDRPPFGGNRKEYLSYMASHFEVKTFERAYNSIPPRQGNELFGIFVKSP